MHGSIISRLSSMLAVALLAAGTAQADTRPVEDLPPEMVRQIGNAMYEQDRYAAQATDLLFREKGGPERLEQEGLRGDWVLIRGKDSIVVRFVRETSGGDVAAYDVVFPSGQLPYVRRPTDGRLSEAAAAQLRARRLAVEQVGAGCSENYNTVVLQRRPDADFLVYALAAIADPGQMMIGGHYRVTVTPDGRKVVKAEQLYRSCLTLPASSDASAIPWLTHLVSARPMETHVYLSLLYKRPFYVGVGKSAWRVENGTVALVEKPK